MEITELSIKDILLIKPCLHEDRRGYLYESFNQSFFNISVKSNVSFLQDIHSYSNKNVLRGLHYQLQPKAQAKLIRVIIGEIFDVAVDLRKNSPTFGRWTGHILSKSNKLQMWIPEGFANGFLVLSDHAEVIYKVTEEYHPQLERTIAWNDPNLSITWPIDTAPIISDKDILGCTFNDAEIHL
jgi:dTDP-4-dehydrorhamnose 3,5-epimerase